MPAFDPLSIGTIADDADVEVMTKNMKASVVAPAEDSASEDNAAPEVAMTKAERKRAERKALMQAKKKAKKNGTKLQTKKDNVTGAKTNEGGDDSEEEEDADALEFSTQFDFHIDGMTSLQQKIEESQVAVNRDALDNIISRERANLKATKLKNKKATPAKAELTAEKTNDDDDDVTIEEETGLRSKKEAKSLEEAILGKEKRQMDVDHSKDYLDGENEEEEEEEGKGEIKTATEDTNLDKIEGLENDDDDDIFSVGGADAEDDDGDDFELMDRADEAMESASKDKVSQKRKALYFTTPEDAMRDSKKGKQDRTNSVSDGKKPSYAIESFTAMNIARPILKGITAMGFAKPTDIQARAIPIALRGLDICGSALTGSGKTGAFIIPILERLMYRPRDTPCTRVLILVPTRELGAQCHAVATSLAKFTDITSTLLVGGLNQKSQEADLKRRPDIVIATPGRLIDHVYNAHSFTLDDIEILVLDEADRMLEDGFHDELTEIIKATNKNRQTMLFSATMTENVDDLVRLSLRRPVRITVDTNNGITNKLVQEFVRVRVPKQSSTTIQDKGGNNISPQQQLLRALQTRKTCILLALCKRSFRSETIIFFGSKQRAHEMRIIFGLMDLKCAELHGNLTQQQRIEALDKFRSKSVDFLLATDLASRGLDIKGVRTVINFDMPKQYQQYVHRVGRTARAGQCGRSVSLITEQDRQILKLAIKNSSDEIKTRIVKPEVVHALEAAFERKIRTSLVSILAEEKTDKEIRVAEMNVNKVQNMIKYEQEIKGRPKKVWFQTKAEQEKSKREAAAKMHADKKKARSKTKKNRDLPTVGPYAKKKARKTARD